MVCHLVRKHMKMRRRQRGTAFIRWFHSCAQTYSTYKQIGNTEQIQVWLVLFCHTQHMHRSIASTKASRVLNHSLALPCKHWF